MFRYSAPIATATVLLVAAVHAHGQVVVQGIGHLGTDITHPDSRASVVSADGSVVAGHSSDSENRTQAILWTAETGLEGLGFLPDSAFPSSRASGISADGQTVVGRSWSAQGFEAYRWNVATGMVGLGDFPDGAFDSAAHGVSGDGSIVVGFGRHDPYPEAFLWTQAGGMVGLGYLEGPHAVSYATDITPDGSVIVGHAGSEAFRWTQATGMVGLGDAGGDLNTGDVSADGSTLVGEGPSDSQAFRWTQTTGIVTLGEFPGGADILSPSGISSDGTVIVGVAIRRIGKEASFVWDEVHGMRNLTQVLVDEYGLKLNGWHIGQALDISEDALTIVGAGTNPDRQTEGWVIQLPYPLGPPPSIPIVIDIKPGNDSNPVNLGAQGVLPVAVLTTSVADGDLIDFDAATVDPSSLTLAGAAPHTKGRSGRVGSLADIDGDGDLDLLVHFPIAELELTERYTEAVLLGQTFDGIPIQGSDTISVRGIPRIAPEALRQVK